MKVLATKNFRQNLRIAMVSRRISQRDMAVRASVSYPYVNRILQGKATPDLETCDKLADKVGFPLDIMLLPTREFSRRCSRESARA